MASSSDYDLVVVGSGFAGCMATLSFLEECAKNNKPGKVALVEVGKEGERSGASKWTMVCPIILSSPRTSVHSYKRRTSASTRT